MQDSQNPFAQSATPPTRQRSSLLWWVLGGAGILALVCCGGIVMMLGYVGVAGPETSVYAGNQVPERFLATAREVGVLDPGEKVRFFYSDALVDIRQGFYFVSNKKVVVYTDDGRAEPAIVIDFDNIANAEIIRNESFFEDSQITIETKDGQYVAFPVSSEFDRDQLFCDAISEHVKPAGRM